MASTWTDDMLAHLTELVKDGVSFGKIVTAMNNRFGLSLTRNACIGKAHRTGLYHPNKPERAPLTPRQPRPRRAPRWHLPPPPSQDPSGLPADTFSVDRLPYPHKCTLLALTSVTCRWPVGDPLSSDFFFCGGASDNRNGRPYCDHHAANAAHKQNRPRIAPGP
jgi:GcrA cell cycle regulator